MHPCRRGEATEKGIGRGESSGTTEVSGGDESEREPDPLTLGKLEKLRYSNFPSSNSYYSILI
jgi:hypothetical protein